MIRNILVPVDGSANSVAAIDYGAAIAPKLAASMTGLHVIDVYLIQGVAMTDTATTMEMPPYDGFVEGVETTLNDEADNVLKYFEDCCTAAGVPCRPVKYVGTIKSSIIEEAENADLVVMAKKGRYFHLQEGGLVGSVTEVVVRRCGKPVMVTPGSVRVIERIGLAYDGSASAKEALALALDISGQTKWPITVVIVNSDPSKAADLSAQLEEIVQKGQAECEVILSKGRDAEEILDFIRKSNIDLMVMGAFGHNRLRELLLGSTTSRILQESPIPVLLIRDPLKIRKRNRKR